VLDEREARILRNQSHYDQQPWLEYFSRLPNFILQIELGEFYLSF
jgi:hypothetical protein